MFMAGEFYYCFSIFLLFCHLPGIQGERQEKWVKLMDDVVDAPVICRSTTERVLLLLTKNLLVL